MVLKGDFVKELSDEAIAKHLEHASRLPTWQSTMHLYPVNGKVHRVSESDTAFGYRDAVWSEVIAGVDPTHPRRIPRQLRAAGGDQSQIRSGEFLPREPEPSARMLRAQRGPELPSRGQGFCPAAELSGLRIRSGSLGAPARGEVDLAMQFDRKYRLRPETADGRAPLLTI